MSILIGRHLINTFPNLEAKQMVSLLAKSCEIGAKKEVYVSSSSSKVHCEEQEVVLRVPGGL